MSFSEFRNNNQLLYKCNLHVSSNISKNKPTQNYIKKIPDTQS